MWSSYRQAAKQEKDSGSCKYGVDADGARNGRGATKFVRRTKQKRSRYERFCARTLRISPQTVSKRAGQFRFMKKLRCPGRSQGLWSLVCKASSMKRSNVLSVLAGIGIAATGKAQGNGMIYRSFGKTNEKVSAIGLGGHHIGLPQDPNEGIRIIRSAIDRGITFMDNCWDYHNGESERRMGLALGDGYRQKVFLMTKFDGRTKDSTARQIDESLRRLQTDHVDLIQFHENIRMEDPDRFFASGGSLEALMDAKKAGKIRQIGFTGHKDPAVHLRMLEAAAAHGFEHSQM